MDENLVTDNSSYPSSGKRHRDGIIKMPDARILQTNAAPKFPRLMMIVRNYNKATCISHMQKQIIMNLSLKPMI
ncbi:hypothetical protein CISIN_1g035102mg [Citrus sinensis]|uniref:Uncharacterized protein n=1 Tax=Citrus sinensis TaxID=2711 RepID=A0A067DCA7_CITSI|nr:hypothetical protein CISIN_1g035102mg [Citrus sinensis]